MINWNNYGNKLMAMANRVTMTISRGIGLDSDDEKLNEAELQKAINFKKDLLHLVRKYKE